MLLADEPNIARSSPSPLTQNAQNLSIGAPGTVSQRQLDELNIRFKLEV
jgi:aspartyl-tRNA synthetase